MHFADPWETSAYDGLCFQGKRWQLLVQRRDGVDARSVKSYVQELPVLLAQAAAAPGRAQLIRRALSAASTRPRGAGAAGWMKEGGGVG